MGFKLGMEAKAYRNTGTYGTPTWNEIPNIKDLTLNLDKEKADATTRGNNGWKATVAALKNGSVEFNMVYDPADDDVTAMRDGYYFDQTLDMLFLDGPLATDGSQGFRADMMVSKFTREEPLTAHMEVAVMLEPTYSANAPKWVEAASSAVTEITE